MMSDYPDAMSTQPVSVGTTASRVIGAACVLDIATEGHRAGLLPPSDGPRYVTWESMCIDGGFTWAVR
jgi:hypothetical protein